MAHTQVTGKTNLLNVMRRYAIYIVTLFGSSPDRLRGYCGHPEIELALVKLYRLTGERPYLDLAKFFIDERGRQPHYFDQEAVARGEDPTSVLSTGWLCQHHRGDGEAHRRPPILSRRPSVFPRLLQKAIWMFCAEARLGICNGNRIDDRDRCTQTACPLFISCERVPLRRQLAEV